MHNDPSFLTGLWFVLIGVLWTGFFILEGFDFGVGVLVKALGRDRVEKRMMIHTIGPVWDGNEVWLLTAGGAMFAAFPEWYATTFSGFYLALFLVLACLILRGVSFEFWGKVDSDKWRGFWEWTLAIGSGVAALLFGVAWANFVRGVPMSPGPAGTSNYIIHATVFTLLNPFGLLGGLTFVAVFLTHGASFLTLRLKGDLQQRAAKFASVCAPVAVVLGLAFVIWTMSLANWRWTTVVLGALTAVALVVAMLMHNRNEIAAFLAIPVGILTLVATFLTALYPYAIPSRTSKAYSLPLSVASSSHYTLTVMSIVAFIFVPIVLGYTTWTYWVFRHRLGRDDYEGHLDPVSVLGSKLSS